MTTAEMEQYIRSKWELVSRCDGSYRHYEMGTVLIQDVHNHWFDFDSWQAAYDFTLAREEEIRQVEEEIKFLHELKSFGSWVENHTGWQRILAREQAALADLKRGMKTNG